MVLYFTGTNNSRYIAEKIAKSLNENIICINDKIKDKDTSTILVKDRMIFVLPTYAWRIPKVVEEWIRKTEFLGSRKAWFIMNCGEDIGNAAKYNKDLCDDTLFTYMGTARVVMPENYIAMFDVPDKRDYLILYTRFIFLVTVKAGCENVFFVTDPLGDHWYVSEHDYE